MKGTKTLAVVLAASLLFSGVFPVNVFASEEVPAAVSDSETMAGDDETIESESIVDAETETETEIETETESETETKTESQSEETQYSESDMDSSNQNNVSDETEADVLLENSWRYTDGVWTPQEIVPYAENDFTPWTWQGEYYINSMGDPIPNALRRGIDVSEQQGEIDWEKGKADDVSFAIIRCGYGSNREEYDDKYWEINADACTRLGIPFGVYFYSYADDVEDAVSEAEHVIRLLEGYDLDYPVYYDLEDENYVGKLSNSEILELSQIFYNMLSDAGYEVGFYANKYWWNTKLTDSWYDQHPRWVAQYNYQCDYAKNYDMWQATPTGKIDGISTNVDINFDYTPDSQLPGTEEPSQEYKDIEAFVYRLYTNVLGREPEDSGLEYWTERLYSKEITGAEAAWGFIFTPEFENKNIDNETYVNILYNTCLDRDADADGLDYWVNYLNNHLSREFVLRGFIESREFSNICSTYGIERGSISLTEIQDLNPEITLFISRCYRVFLDRDGELSGIQYWVSRVASGELTPGTAAFGFIFSPEFKNKNYSDEEYVTYLYRGFFDREPEDGDVEYWTSFLKNGKTREFVFDGFNGSQEFYNLIKSFGL